jgi:hypothetical protein
MFCDPKVFDASYEIIPEHKPSAHALAALAASGEGVADGKKAAADVNMYRYMADGTVMRLNDGVLITLQEYLDTGSAGTMYVIVAPLLSARSPLTDKTVAGTSLFTSSSLLCGKWVGSRRDGGACALLIAVREQHLEHISLGLM